MAVQQKVIGGPTS